MIVDRREYFYIFLSYEHVADCRDFSTIKIFVRERERCSRLSIIAKERSVCTFFSYPWRFYEQRSL